jgi:hypothetical protein
MVHVFDRQVLFAGSAGRPPEEAPGEPGSIRCIASAESLFDRVPGRQLLHKEHQAGQDGSMDPGLVARYYSIARREFEVASHGPDYHYPGYSGDSTLNTPDPLDPLQQTLTRPANLIPGTSFARLLPPLNTFHHSPHPPVSLDQLRKRLNDVVSAIGLAADPTLAAAPASAAASGPRNILYLAPRSNTWSRAARRQAAREHQSGVKDEDASANGVTTAIGEEARAPLFRAQLRLSHSAERDGTAELGMDWLEGKGADRAGVEALWKFVLSKANVVGKRPRDAGDVGTGPEHPSSRGGSRGGRGGRGGRQ